MAIRAVTALTLGTAVAACALAPFTSGGEAAAKSSCRDINGRVLVVTQSARITSVRGEGFRTWYACLDRVGRRVRLDHHDQRGYPDGTQQLSTPRLAGRYAAFIKSESSTYGTTESAVLVDIASRARSSTGVLGRITDMVISRQGDLVFLSPGGREPGTVVRLNASGATTLEEGAVEPGSLAMSPDGRFVYWQDAGTPRRAELRPSAR